MRCLFLMSALAAQALGQTQENDYYRLDTFTPPQGAVLEVGGMDYLPDGRLALSTRRGQVWLVDGAQADDVSKAGFTLFEEGLREGLGLAVVGGNIHVVQRGELTRLVDLDGDDRCDQQDTLCADWGLSGNYHEFAFGLPVDDQGNFYVSFNVSFFSSAWWHGRSTVPYRGWCLKIAPDGTMSPVAYGLRSPCGLGFNAEGDLFATDNQGDWVASSPLYHITQDAFFGHPASLTWTDEYLATGAQPSSEIPPAAASRRKPPAVWIPYKWSRSTGNVQACAANGGFGPFDDDLFVAELTNGMVLRALLEKVRGEYQGAIVPFRTELGSAARIEFAPNGDLMLGYTNRGWGGRSPADGLARLRWTGEVPLEYASVHLLQDGFEVGLTLPLADDVAVGPDAIDALQYDYNYWWEYGSPVQRVQPLEASSVTVSDDRKTVTVRFPELTAATCVDVTLNGLRTADGKPLLHPEFSYTINQLPEGEPVTELVAKIVPPPPSKENALQGWLRLTWLDALQMWESEGWELCNAELDSANARAFQITEGNGALVNTGDAPSHFVSKPEFGDCQVELEFMLPEKGNSGVYLMGRYEVQLSDATGVRDPGFNHCGGIYKGDVFAGSPPKLNAWTATGQWQKLEVDFQAPRFDAEGNKIEDALFRQVKLNGMLVQENVRVNGLTGGALFPSEGPTGPLMLQGDHGPVAYRGIQVKPMDPPLGTKGWEPVFPIDSFYDWPSTGDASWELNDEDWLIGTGKMGHIFSPRGDFENFELMGRMRINDGGNSGLYFRVQPTEGWPKGYEAQINSSHPDPQKTGSLYGLSPVRTELVPEGAWFDYHVTCRSTDAGTRIEIRVNGALINEFVDTEQRHGPGHIALQQHHEGSRLEVQSLWIREL